MKRFALALALVAALFAVACASGPAVPEQAELVILHVNDTHGQLADTKGVGGLAAVAAYVKSVQAAYPNVLFLHAGDLNTGSMVSDKNLGLPNVEIFNTLGLAAMTVGNHEFDMAPGVIDKQMALAKYPYISANIVKDGKLAFKPYIVKNVNGLKVGIFGITTSDTPVKAHPLKVEGYTFTDEIAAAAEMVKVLRETEKVQVVIGLFHVGFGSGAGPKPSDVIAAAVPGIDLIVDGHSHTAMDAPKLVNGIPIVMADSNTKRVGKAVLSYDKGAVNLSSWTSAMMDGSVAPDSEVAAMVKGYKDEIDAKYGVKIGSTTAPFDLGANLTRKQETALANLVTDAMVWKARAMGIKADFAITNGGGIRKTIPAGDITRLNAYEVLPFGNTLAYMEMSGAKVLELFDNVAKIPHGNGGWANMSKDVRYTVDTKAKAISGLTIGGKAVDPNATYIVITNDFLAVGGDGVYPVFKTVSFKDTFIDMLEGFIEYIQSMPQPMEPKTDGRMQVLL